MDPYSFHHAGDDDRQWPEENARHSGEDGGIWTDEDILLYLQEQFDVSPQAPWVDAETMERRIAAYQKLSEEEAPREPRAMMVVGRPWQGPVRWDDATELFSFDGSLMDIFVAMAEGRPFAENGGFVLDYRPSERKDFDLDVLVDSSQLHWMRRTYQSLEEVPRDYRIWDPDSVYSGAWERWYGTGVELASLMDVEGREESYRRVDDKGIVAIHLVGKEPAEEPSLHGTAAVEDFFNKNYPGMDGKKPGVPDPFSNLFAQGGFGTPMGAWSMNAMPSPEEIESIRRMLSENPEIIESIQNTLGKMASGDFSALEGMGMGPQDIPESMREQLEYFSEHSDEIMRQMNEAFGQMMGMDASEIESMMAGMNPPAPATPTPEAERMAEEAELPEDLADFIEGGLSDDVLNSMSGPEENPAPAAPPAPRSLEDIFGSMEVDLPDDFVKDFVENVGLPKIGPILKPFMDSIRDPRVKGEMQEYANSVDANRGTVKEQLEDLLQNLNELDEESVRPFPYSFVEALRENISKSLETIESSEPSFGAGRQDVVVDGQPIDGQPPVIFSEGEVGADDDVDVFVTDYGDLLDEATLERMKRDGRNLKTDPMAGGSFTVVVVGDEMAEGILQSDMHITVVGKACKENVEGDSVIPLFEYHGSLYEFIPLLNLGVPFALDGGDALEIGVGETSVALIDSPQLRWMREAYATAEDIPRAYRVIFDGERLADIPLYGLYSQVEATMAAMTDLAPNGLRTEDMRIGPDGVVHIWAVER